MKAMIEEVRKPVTRSQETEKPPHASLSLFHLLEKAEPSLKENPSVTAHQALPSIHQDLWILSEEEKAML